MRFVLFVLSVELLALGVNLPGTSGQKVTGGAPSPPTVHGLPPSSEKLDLKQRLVLTCFLRGFNPDATLRWFHNDEAVETSVQSASNPLWDGGTPKEPFPYAKFIIQRRDLERRDEFICLADPAVLPPLTVQETKDKDTGNPSSSNKTGPQFQEAEAESEMSISCVVEGDRPPGVSIVWQENRRRLTEGAYSVHTNSEDHRFLYSTLILPNTTRLIGRLYLCTIGQQRD